MGVGDRLAVQRGVPPSVQEAVSQAQAAAGGAPRSSRQQKRAGPLTTLGSASAAGTARRAPAQALGTTSSSPECTEGASTDPSAPQAGPEPTSSVWFVAPDSIMPPKPSTSAGGGSGQAPQDKCACFCAAQHPEGGQADERGAAYDTVILDYLSRRGFSKAETAMRAEIAAKIAGAAPGADGPANQGKGKSVGLDEFADRNAPAGEKAGAGAQAGAAGGADGQAASKKREGQGKNLIRQPSEYAKGYEGLREFVNNVRRGTAALFLLHWQLTVWSPCCAVARHPSTFLRPVPAPPLRPFLHRLGGRREAGRS